MSLTTLNHPLPGGGLSGPLPSPWRGLDGLGRRLRQHAWAAIWWAWMGLHLCSVGLARLVNWFADDPRRLRIALTGTLVCSAVGAVVGAGLGWLLARLVALAIDVVWAAQA